MKNRVVLTIDIDWAPDEVLARTLDMFSGAGVPCTLFATHDTPFLRGLDPSMFEVGLHPNFNSLLKGDSRRPEQLVAPLREHFPDARGIRSHSSMVSNVLVELFGHLGFEYECNVFLPYSTSLELLPLWNGMTRVPFNWEDYLHFSYGNSFTTTGLDLSQGLHVLTFHPVHVFLNTENMDRYRAARLFYQDAEALKGFRNTGRGTATLLQELLESDLPFAKLEDVVDAYREKNK